MNATFFHRFLFLLTLLCGFPQAGARNLAHDLQLNEIRRSLNPNVLSRGYLLGILTPTSRGVVWRTFEALLILGPHSLVGEFYDVNCLNEAQSRRLNTSLCVLGHNPIRISSFNTELTRSIINKKNLVLVRYVKYKMTAIVESRTIAKAIFVTQPELERPGAFMEDQSIHVAKNINYAEGIITGRVVKASLDGILRLTYEIIIQAGEGGDKYMAMSVASRDLFEFIVEAMATGRMVQLQYVHLFRIHSRIQQLLGYDTDFRVLAVKVL